MSQANVADDLPLMKLEQLKSLVEWIGGLYKLKARLPEGYVAAADFLQSSFVVQSEALGHELESKDRYRVFWFDDVISSHFRIFRRRKKMFPYVYDTETGLIKPFSRFESASRKKIHGKLGIQERRVDFHWQPGFVAQVVRCDNETTIFFGGTKGVWDWMENLIQLFGLVPPQFRMASDLTRAVCETSKGRVRLVGHSEGGGEVQYAIVRNIDRWWRGNSQLHGIAFNSQRLSGKIVPERMKKKFDETSGCSVDQYRLGADIVSGLKCLGKVLLGHCYTISDQRMMFMRFRPHQVKYLLAVLKQKCAESR